MPLYHGSLIKQGLFWAVIAIAVFWATSFFSNSRFYAIALMLIWTIAWWLILYRNAKRHERRHHQTR